MRLNQPQEKVMQPIDLVNKMCEAAASEIRHTVLQQTFLHVSRKTTL